MNDPGDLVARDQLVERAGDRQIRGDIHETIEELRGEDSLEAQRLRSEIAGDDGQTGLEEIPHDPGADAPFAAGDEEPLVAFRHRSESITRNAARM